MTKVGIINVALGTLCTFPISNSFVELEQTEKTDAAVFCLNKSIFSLWGVLCAAEVFVVPRAFDKASCSSLAKCGTYPQGPQVGVGSPAALCAHFVIWILFFFFLFFLFTHTQAHTQWGSIFPYIDLKALLLNSSVVFYPWFQYSVSITQGFLVLILIQSSMGTNALYSRSQINTFLHP